MAGWLKAFHALAENPGLNISTYTVAPYVIPVLGIQCTQDMNMVHRHTYIQNSYTYKNMWHLYILIKIGGTLQISMITTGNSEKSQT